MSALHIFDKYQLKTPEKIVESANEIAATLENINVLFTRWPATQILTEKTSDEEILAAYDKEISQLKTQCGFKSVDVVHMFPDHPQKDMLRKKFLQEHTHIEDEIRFFVEGGGLFYLNQEEKIFVIHCKKNDLISVPKGIKHWFDAGLNPRFTAIRFFTNTDGWIANYTGNTIAEKFEDYQDHEN